MPVRSRLLVVESAAVIRRAMSRAADTAGLSLIEASELPGALTQIEEEIPAAILTATEIGAFPGLSLLASLRASATHRSVPVAFITSRPDLVESGSWRGCPVLEKSPALCGAAASWLASIGFSAETRKSSDSPIAGRRILIAEDMEVMRKLISHKLHARGAEVTVASDGVEASVLALSGSFDLIVLDIEMPRLDGRDAIRLIREAGVKTPVCALTAHDNPETILWLKTEDGFDDVISKPNAIEGIEKALTPNKWAA